MTRAVWGVVVVAFLALAVAGPAKMVDRHRGGGATATGAVVHMRGLQFAPHTLQVTRATTVVFVNDDVAPHTVTADGAGGVDSGVLQPGKSYRLAVNDILHYHCAIHPQMTATVELKG